MGLHKKNLKYYEDKHNLKFPSNKIKVINRIDNYIYFLTDFGKCKMHISNIGKANFSIFSAIDKTDFLIKKLKKLHGDIYDYSLVKYNKKSNEKITLICNKHGNFEKVINTLIVNKNVYCPKCYNQFIRKNNRISNTEKFIKKANIIYNNKYDYSKTDYKNAKTKIKIICLIHGEFEQTPSNHLSGYSCKKCADIDTKKYQEENSSGWSVKNWLKTSSKSKNFDSFKVYIIECWNDEERFYKIGRTFKKIKYRFSGKISFPYNFKIIEEIKGDIYEIYNLETKLKRINKENKYIPKIKFNGMQECFIKINKNERTI